MRRGELNAPLRYDNPESINPHKESMISNLADGVRLGHAYIFPREEAESNPGLHVSPLGVAVSPS